MKGKKRLLIISISIFSLFSLLIIQYFKIQILEGEKWTKEALSQHEFIVKESFRRGSFFSNTSLKLGHPEKCQTLVFDVTKFHLFIDPASIPKDQKKKIAPILFSMIEGKETEKVTFFSEFEKKSRSRKISSWLDRKTREKIEKWWIPYSKKNKIPRNAVYFVTDYKRSYPFDKLLGQVLHTIRDFKDEKTEEAIPTGGLEAYFNKYLNGKMGKRKLLRSPLNSLDIDKVIQEPENGADIYLTINHYIQAIAEEELEKGVKAVKAKGGWAIMMDPFTGEIFALAQYPFFEPENYREYFNDPDKMEIAKVKSINDAFELGSIMKPITLAISLLANEECKKQNKSPIFNPVEKIDTSRRSFPGRSKPLKDTTNHKYLNMNMALQKSSNVYMAELIDRVVNQLGNEWYRKQLVDVFGFGKKTGIELPAETSGLVPRIGKLHPNGTLEWSTPTPYSLAMGYNILATSLQMVRAFAVIANGGFLVEPTLVKKIVKTVQEEEKVLLDHTGSLRANKFPRVMPKEIADLILKAMKYTTKPGGTAKLADLSGYSEGGKTGTAEKIVNGVYCKNHHISSFVGVAPVNLNAEIPPRFILLVSIDDPEAVILQGGIKAYFGGGCAAPVFREIASRTLEYMGIPLDDPYGFPAGDPRSDLSKADWNKEIKELKALYEEWNHKK